MQASIATEREHAMNPESTAPPRVLLVEDDPVSRAFLLAAAQATPAVVDSAGGVREARALASRHRYALWLVDANLPDGRGIDLLASLRTADADAVALAHTADTTRTAADDLIAAGFREVLVKPLPASAVQAAIRRALSRGATCTPSAPVHGAGSKQPVWDDDAAARALGGNPGHVSTLRGLFVRELPTVLATVARARSAGDDAALRGELHRLRASCGFVGAARLGAAAAMLEQAVDAPTQAAAHARFSAAAQDTLDQAPSVPG